MKEPVGLPGILAREISRISEQRWCATWFDGIEYALWTEIVIGSEDPDVIALGELAQLARGWVTWAWGDKEPGPVFMPRDVWISRWRSQTGGVPPDLKALSR